MTTLSLLGLIFALVSGLHAVTLVPPFDQGVVVKVSEQLITDIAQVLTDKAAEEIKALTLSGQVVEGGITYDYWDLQFQELSLTPEIDLTKQSGHDRLILDGTARGNLEATASWRVSKKVWFYTVEFDGQVTVSSNGFGVTGRVIMGENEEGDVGFTHDPTYCSLDIGEFTMYFSGTKLGWFINLFVSFFEEEIRAVLEQYVCLEINAKVAEGAKELETAIFDRYDVIYVLGHTLEINNRPWIVTGGESCAVVGALGGIDLDMSPDKEEAVTEHFIPPTLPPLVTDEKPEDRTDYTSTHSTSHSTSSSSSSSTSSTSHSIEMRVKREESEVVNWCDVLPGAGRGVSVIITEEMIERIGTNLHDVGLVDYRATQAKGSSDMYVVSWGGKNAGEMRISTPDNAFLRDSDVTFRIVSTAPPNVTIDRDGISVLSTLRTRITLQSSNSMVTKLEIHTAVKFFGVCHLTIIDGVYTLVPSVTGNADITNARLAIGGTLGINLDDGTVQLIEAQLNEMLDQKVPALIREELKTGFPLNIPNNLVIEDATVEYHENYVMITADDVVVNI